MLPCILHDARYLHELLAPPEPPYPRPRKVEDLGAYGDYIISLLSLPDGSTLVGGVGGHLKRRTADSTWEDLGAYGNNINSLLSLPDGSTLVGGGGGKLQRWAPDPQELQRWKERKLQPPEIPEMPE